MAPLLEINDLQTEIRLKQAAVHAVDGVGLHVEPGETLGIVGESGCGKTMTALSIMRLLPTGGRSSAGSIMLDGQEISDLPDDDMRHVRGNEIGMIFQDPMTSLNPTMTVGQADRRDGRAAPGRQQRARPGTGPSRCSTWSGMPQASGAGRATTRTSSPAACASA